LGAHVNRLLTRFGGISPSLRVVGLIEEWLAFMVQEAVIIRVAIKEGLAQ